VATILVVDDQPDLRQLISVNLQLDGHEVVTASNGAEALEAVKARVPDVMVLDVMMPDVSGWEVLASIKAEADIELRNIPVLMLTANDAVEDRLRGGIEGAIRYILKPFSPDDLRQEVRDALEGEPEPVRRRQAQRASLQELARIESGGDATDSTTSRPRLTRYERPVPVAPVESAPQLTAAREQLDELTDKQRELLDRLASAPSVSDAAAGLGVSRSNVYASLRRITRKLGVASVPELLTLVRSGDLFDA
jgi:two-component system, OmpR family, response regulator